MKVATVVCDNCGREISRDDPRVDGRSKQARRARDAQTAKVGGRVFDLCDGCGNGRPVDLAAVPAEDWPRYVRREDVHRFLATQGN